MLNILPKVQHLDTSNYKIGYTQLSNKVKINHAEIGQGKIIVMIHGMANNWISLIPISQILKHKYRLILVDLPGYGDSSVLPEHNVEALSNYLTEFIVSLGQKPAAIVGFSMSGTVVAEAIRKNHDLVSSAVILGPYISYVDKERLSTITHKFYKITSEHKSLHKPLKKMIEWRLSGYLAGKLLNMHKFDAKKIDTLSIIGRRKLKPGVYSQIGYSVMNYRLDKAFIQIKTPTILVIGEYDKIISPEKLNNIVKSTSKKIKVRVIKNSGHALNMEAVEECASIIDEFAANNINQSV